MNNYSKPVVIAEIGCNHQGNIEIAKEMITVAKTFCKVDIVKFQKRNVKELLTADQYNSPHPNQSNSFGDTYGKHREFLEFNFNQHAELKEFCSNLGVFYSTSVWDLTSAKEIVSLDPGMIKIPSACNNNLEMLSYLAENFKGEIHISTGMTYQSELQDIIELFEKSHRINDIVLYSCTSGYPIPFEDAALLEIRKLKELYGNKVKAIGFSGHHLGIAVDIAAFTLGAIYIERHFTLDRTWKGTDHAASLEPDGMRKLVRNLDACFMALNYKKKEILEIEQIQREKLKYRK